MKVACQCCHEVNFETNPWFASMAPMWGKICPSCRDSHRRQTWAYPRPVVRTRDHARDHPVLSLPRAWSIASGMFGGALLGLFWFGNVGAAVGAVIGWLTGAQAVRR